MAAPSVAVTGLGLVTPAGIGVQASWERVVSGQSAAAKHPDLAGMDVDFACWVPDFDVTAQLGAKAARRMDRFVQFAVVAAREAIADAGLDPETWDGARIGVVVGCGMGGGPTWEAQHSVLLERGPNRVSALYIPLVIPNMAAGQIAIEFHARGPNLCTATACASGATAIGTALDLLRNRRADIVLAGGTEATITQLSIAGFTNMRALSMRADAPERASRPFDRDRDGFVAGEAAGMLVMERAEDAKARGATVRALVAGYGASGDAHHQTAPDPEGRGATQAIRDALADAGLAPDDVTHVNAHGTSTPLNDKGEAAAIRRVLPEDVAVTSTKGVTGHTLGAAGAIEAAFTVLTLQHGLIPPTANLDSQDPEIDLDVVSKEPRESPVAAAISNSFGFGGHNAVLAFTRA